MNKVFRIEKLIGATVSLLLLGGCSFSGINNVVVEERSIKGNGQGQNLGVENNTQVEVTALTVRPTFKTTNNAPTVNTDISQQLKAPEVPAKQQMPATVALLNTASYQSSNGRLQAALTSLERALRISPKDPEVYRSLGEVHRRLGDFVQAEQILLKGIAVAAGQSGHLRKLWSALAKVRSESGDKAGANVAFQKSQSY